MDFILLFFLYFGSISVNFAYRLNTNFECHFVLWYLVFSDDLYRNFLNYFYTEFMIIFFNFFKYYFFFLKVNLKMVVFFIHLHFHWYHFYWNFHLNFAILEIYFLKFLNYFLIYLYWFDYLILIIIMTSRTHHYSYSNYDLVEWILVYFDFNLNHEAKNFHLRGDYLNLCF